MSELEKPGNIWSLSFKAQNLHQPGLGSRENVVDVGGDLVFPKFDSLDYNVSERITKVILVK